jgi:hypothetical protein
MIQTMLGRSAPAAGVAVGPAEIDNSTTIGARARGNALGFKNINRKGVAERELFTMETFTNA